MCARFTLKSSATVLADLFELDEVPELMPRYNVAPSQIIPAVVSQESRRELKFLQWGLIPSWAKDPGIGQGLINARSETAFEKPAFRAAFKRRRCLIPADGFYEWDTVDPFVEESLFPDAAPMPKGGKPIKQPYYFTMKDERPFAFAGLYEFWESPETGASVETCTILTTEPNSLVQPYHTRMPAILKPEAYDIWLDSEPKPSELLCALLVPYDESEMAKRPVTRRMNNARFEGPDCIEPLAA